MQSENDASIFCQSFITILAVIVLLLSKKKTYEFPIHF